MVELTNFAQYSESSKIAPESEDSLLESRESRISESIPYYPEDGAGNGQEDIFNPALNAIGNMENTVSMVAEGCSKYQEIMAGNSDENALDLGDMRKT